MDLQYDTPYWNGGPRPASPPAKLFEFRGDFSAYAIERAAMVTQAACTALPTGHTC
jgi:hypothetical protein